MKKKKLLKVGALSFCTATAIGTGVGINQIKNQDEDVDKDLHPEENNIVRNAIKNSNLPIDELIQKIINENVTQRTYLGDINSATTGGDLSSIDISKLSEINSSSQLLPAYQKITGEYTPSLDDAKRSHLKNPVIKYIDDQGIRYDSENEVVEAMKNNLDSYSQGIAYYEITDYWTNQSKPKTYKINPLNVADIDILKELAIKNAALSDTKFTIGRLSVDASSNYQLSTFKGLTDYQISEKVNAHTRNIVDFLVDNMYMDIEVRNAGGATTGVRFGVNKDFINAHGKVNQFVQISFDQAQFNNIHSAPNTLAEMNRRANDVYQNTKNEVYKMFGNNKNSNIDNLAEKVALTAKKLASSNVMGNMWENKITSGKQSSLQSAINSVKQKLFEYMNEKMNQEFKSTAGSGQIDFYGAMTQGMKSVYQVNNIDSTNTIYTIDYNGMPLFKIDTAFIKPIVNNADFKVDPTGSIKKMIGDNLKSKPAYAKDSIGKLTNISNTYEVKNKQIIFKKSSMDNYNNSNKFSNFGFGSATNSSMPDAKLINEQVYANNGVNKDYLAKELVRRESDNKNVLNSEYGTYEAIYQYNKYLSKNISDPNLNEGLKQNINKSVIKDTNNVVFLYSNNKTNETIKFGRYLDYGYKFNVSLTDESNKIIQSVETLENEFNLENVYKPVKEYNFYDYNNNLVWSEVIGSVNNNYEQAIENAWKNATKKIDVKASSDYVYFKENISSLPELRKNMVNRLYVLDLTNLQGGPVTRNSQNVHGFTSLDNLKQYLYNYIELTQNGALPPVVNPDTPNYVVTRDYSKVVTWSSGAIAMILIISTAMAVYFYYIANRPYAVKMKYNKNVA